MSCFRWRCRSFLGNLLCLLCIYLTTSGGRAVATESAQRAAQPTFKRPNVVYLLSDDVGWGDLSCHGGRVPTPNIDRLFERGVELTQFMGWCVCSPTRAMLLTGRHPIRVGTGPETGGELDPGETTIAEVFQASGYRTGIFGKWHNGNDPDTPEFRAAFRSAFQSQPNKAFVAGHGVNVHGFDTAWVYYGGGADYFTRRTVKGRGPVSWWHNLEYRPDDQGYTDDLVTRHAIEFIEQNRDRPFFCYVPFHIAHAPLQAKTDDLESIDPQFASGLPAASDNVTAEEKRLHAAMLRSMDSNVASIVARLNQLNLLDNTILVFTSDNGAMEAGSSLPLRGHKHTIYEGGIRLPTVIHWPAQGLTGGSTWSGLCSAVDMLPTLADMAQISLGNTRPLDGRSFWPALRDKRTSPVQSCYFVWRDEDALRADRWKLHRFFDRFELYDMKTDETESVNVADKHPDVVQRLNFRMDAWADSLDAALSHRPAPARYHRKPAAAGEVLEVTVTVTPQARPNDRLVVPLVVWDETQFATDWLEFDIAFANPAARRQPWFSPLQGNRQTGFRPLFRRGVGVDQFGREQALGPGLHNADGGWEHRIIGLSSMAPGPLTKHGLVFTGATHGTISVYLDNIRIRRQNGQTTTLWTDSQHTRSVRLEDNRAFRNIRVRAVDAATVAQ